MRMYMYMEKHIYMHDAPFLVPMHLRDGLQPGQRHQHVALHPAPVEEGEPLGDVREQGDAVEELCLMEL